MKHTRKLRHQQNKTKKTRLINSIKIREDKLREKCKHLAVRVLPSFEDKLEKTPKIDSNKVTKIFNGPFI
jgi:hypothetical protein